MALSSKIERSKKDLYQVVATGDHNIFAFIGAIGFSSLRRATLYILHVAVQVQHRQKKMAEAILEREPSLLCGSNWNRVLDHCH